MVNSKGTVVGNYTELITTNEPDKTYHSKNLKVSTNPGNISQFVPYQKVWDSRPMQTYAQADVFVGNEKHTLGLIGNTSDVQLFTSDYGLYWFDYLGGYNTVFGELFGDQNDAVTLAAVRGAADLMGKSWGTMIESSNSTSISLQSGDQIYQ